MKEQFLEYLKESLVQNKFIKLTLGKYRGKDNGLEKIYAEPVKIGDEVFLSFRYKYKTKDIFKNYNNVSAYGLAENLLGKDFLYGALYTLENDIIIEYNKKREPKLFRKKPTFSKVVVKEHDRIKTRFIDSKEKFLNLLGITNKSGTIHSNAYDKFRQIDKFIEIVDSLYRESALSEKETIRIADFGSGKSYLTFALYHYFKKIHGIEAEVKGIEQRVELVDLSNKAAEECGFKGLKFINNNILGYKHNSDIVAALHACDTATDDAISSAVNGGAEIIILAPCCQKYVRKNITIPENLKSIFSHGIIEEHISSFVTDGLRALVLEAFGYKTKVFEFISYEHTSKNIMITAVKDSKTRSPVEKKFSEIQKIKSEFGLKDFYLDKVMKIQC